MKEKNINCLVLGSFLEVLLELSKITCSNNLDNESHNLSFGLLAMTHKTF
jgi:hypothetical protein